MVERMLPSAQSDETGFDELIARCMADADSGRTIDRESLKAEHPNYADRLDEYFHDADFLEQFLSTLRGGSSVPAERPRPQQRPTAVAELPPPAQADPREVAGRYRLIQRLGRGGMGTVHLAYDSLLERYVALKFGNFDANESPELLQRFRSEARALAKLHHPNFCQVYDVSDHEGQPFITMQFVEGRPLADYITDHTLQPVRPAATLVYKLAGALASLHDKKIVHRDLKPMNIMINTDGEPVIVDFGLARREDDPRLSMNGVVIGTPQYMSPEQIQGRSHELGPSADIHSLGVVFYQLLTGRLPYPGRRIEELAIEICAASPKRPSEYCPDLDARVDDICMKMIAGPAESRLASMSAVAAKLAAYLESPEEEEPAVGSIRDVVEPTPVDGVQRPTVCRLSHFSPVSKRSPALDPKNVFTAPKDLGSTDGTRGHATPVQATATLARQLVKPQPLSQTGWNGISPRRLGLVVLFVAAFSGVILGAAAIIGGRQYGSDPPANPAAGVDSGASSPAASAPAAGAAAAAVKAEQAPPREDDDQARLVELVPTADDLNPIAVAFDPSATLTALASENRINLYSLGAENQPQVLLETDKNVHVVNMAGSRDGTILAAVTTDALHVWDFLKIEKRYSFALEPRQSSDPQEQPLTCDTLALSADGQLVAAVDRRFRLRVWNTQTGELVKSLELDHRPDSIAFSPSNAFLAIGHHQGSVIVRGVLDDRILMQTKEPVAINDLEFSPDGRLVVVVARNRSVKVRNASTGTVEWDLPGATNVQRASFTNDGRTLVTASSDQALRLWSVATREEPRQLRVTGEPIELAFSPNGLYVAAVHRQSSTTHDRRSISTWMLPDDLIAGTDDAVLIARFVARGSTIESIALSPDGRLVAAAAGDPEDMTPAQVYIWDLASRSLIRTLPTKLPNVVRLRWSPRGDQLAAMSDSGVFQFWDPQSGEVLYAQSPKLRDGAGALGTAEVFDFDLLAGGSLLALAGSAGVDLIELPSLERSTANSKSSAGRIGAIAGLADRPSFLAGGWRPPQDDVQPASKKHATIFLQEAGRPNPQASWNASGGFVDSISVSRDGVWALTGSEDLELWDLRSTPPALRQRWRTAPTGDRYASMVGAVSPDGSRVLLATREGTFARLFLLDAAGHEICSLAGRQGGLNAVAFTPDGRLALSAGDQALDVWRLPLPTTRDRSIISWVFRNGGEVLVQNENQESTGYTSNAGLLPEGDLKLVGILLNAPATVPNKELGRLEGLQYLRELQFIGHPVAGGSLTDEGAGKLANLPSLTMLFFNNNHVTDAALENLSRLPSVEHLGLRRTDITNAGVAHLVTMLNLRVLDLGQTAIGDEALPHLNALPNLTDLYLDDTQVTDNLVNLLGGFPRLELLDLRNSDVSEAVAARLRAQFPGARILWSPRRNAP